MADLKDEVSQIEHADSTTDAVPKERIFANNNAPRRSLGIVEIVSAGYNICNSWAGVSATMYVGILAGGSSTIIYGVIVCFLFTGCNVLSLAELAVRYPSAGGQYHWTWLVASPRSRRIASYTTAVVNIFAWLAIAASICVIVPNFLFGLLTINHGFVVQRWHLFLVYQAFNLITLLYNILILPRASLTHDIGFVLTLPCMLAFWITCLAKASPKAATSEVWTSFVSEGLGWPRGIIFLTGLSNPNYMYAGVDGAIHLAEDALNPTTAVPWALMSTLLIGFVTAFAFAVSMFYCISDPEAVAASPVPITEIWRQATQSSAAATTMTALIIVIAFFSLNACQQTASRLTWSFGRDHGLVFSGHLGKIHPRLNVPVWALLANAFVVLIIGCVFLANANAFNATIGTSMILMHVSIAIPVALLVVNRRDARNLPQNGHWNLGAFGWVPNVLTILWAAVVTVFYCFPTTNAPTSSDMNYACVVLGVMGFFGVLNWFFYARRKYQGPRNVLQRETEAQRF